MATEQMKEIHLIPNRYPRGEYLLLFDPIDGSSNIDVDMTVGDDFFRVDCSGGFRGPDDTGEGLS